MYNCKTSDVNMVYFKKTDNNMRGTFQATAGFQDSDIFQKAVKSEMHLQCEISSFRIQTLIWSHPCNDRVHSLSIKHFQLI